VNPHWHRARHIAWLFVFASFLIAGCARPPGAEGQNGLKNSFWAGRLALQVESEPPQSFHASFELKGTAQTGELSLFSPLGNTLAVLNWSPQAATLNSGGTVREFSSLDTLVAQVTGTPIPIPALFAWLAGDQASATGWATDLSQLADGRLVARRTDPLPTAVLRVVLEQ